MFLGTWFAIILHKRLEKKLEKLVNQILFLTFSRNYFCFPHKGCGGLLNANSVSCPSPINTPLPALRQAFRQRAQR